jgi:hypothetical protein
MVFGFLTRSVVSVAPKSYGDFPKISGIGGQHQSKVDRPADIPAPETYFPATTAFCNQELSGIFPSMPHQDDFQVSGPVENMDGSTASITRSGLTTGLTSRRFAAPIARSGLAHSVDVNSTPIQIWEGTVVSIDTEQDRMRVSLLAKIGQIPRHTGEIDLEWVTEQDKDLVREGAVFYLTLFKRTKRGSIENTQELRFRRRPSWSASQIKQVARDAEMIRSKMKPLPTAK